MQGNIAKKYIKNFNAQYYFRLIYFKFIALFKVYFI